MLYPRSKVRKFVFLFEGRTGSRFTVEALNKCKNILALGEHLHAIHDQGSARQLEWTDRFFSPRLLGKYVACGFKTKLRHVLDREGFASLLRKHNVRIFHMKRRNVLKQAISAINAERLFRSTKLYNLYRKEHALPPLELDKDALDEVFAWRSRLDADLESFVESLQLPVEVLHYEDLLIDIDGYFQRIFEFLHMNSRRVRGDTLKITDDDLRNAISNYSQIREEYAGTKYEAMFD